MAAVRQTKYRMRTRDAGNGVHIKATAPWRNEGRRPLHAASMAFGETFDVNFDNVQRIRIVVRRVWGPFGRVASLRFGVVAVTTTDSGDRSITPTCFLFATTPRLPLVVPTNPCIPSAVPRTPLLIYLRPATVVYRTPVSRACNTGFR